jgi:tRNA U34 5-carboxymethylaminomethyl modifying enzyme MnmG/GidA
MADGVYPAPGALVRAGEMARLFVIETEDATDALVEVLSVFAVQQVVIVTADFTRGEGGAGRLRVEAGRLSGERAEQVTERLRAAPVVRAVSIGWREV